MPPASDERGGISRTALPHPACGHPAAGHPPSLRRIGTALAAGSRCARPVQRERRRLDASHRHQRGAHVCSRAVPDDASWRCPRVGRHVDYPVRAFQCFQVEFGCIKLRDLGCHSLQGAGRKRGREFPSTPRTQRGRLDGRYSDGAENQRGDAGLTPGSPPGAAKRRRCSSRADCRRARAEPSQTPPWAAASRPPKSAPQAPETLGDEDAEHQDVLSSSGRRAKFAVVRRALVALRLGVLIKILDRPHQALRVDPSYRPPDFVRFGCYVPGPVLRASLASACRLIQSDPGHLCPPPQWRRNRNRELRGRFADLIRRPSAAIWR